MPYIQEFLLCSEMGWTWQDIQSTPKPVLDYFLFYRDLRAQKVNRKD